MRGSVLKSLVIGVLLVGALAFAQTENRVPKFSVGLDYLTFAWVQADEYGGVKSTWGFNALLGFSYREYAQPLMPEQGSTYWEAGTTVLLSPYIGFGYDYRINESVYIGGGVDFHPLFALFIPIPNIHVGFYLF